MGYLFSGRIIYAYLKALTERKAFGLVDLVIIMGALMPSDAED